MNKSKRQPTTVYLDPKLARAVKVKAAMTESTVSDLINKAIARELSRDEEHLRIVRERRKEPARDYEDFIKELKRDGLI